MTGPAAAEAELRALVGEAVGHLRLISEGAPGTLRPALIRQILNEATRALKQARDLADRLT